MKQHINEDGLMGPRMEVATNFDRSILYFTTPLAKLLESRKANVLYVVLYMH